MKWVNRYDSKASDLGNPDLISDELLKAYNTVQREKLAAEFEIDPGVEIIRHYRSANDRWFDWLNEAAKIYLAKD